MATKQTALLSNRTTQTAAGTPNNAANDGGKLRTMSGTVALATTDIDDNDIIMLCGVPTGAVVHEIWIANDDLDVNATETIVMNVGIWKEADDTAENGDEDVYATLSLQFQDASAFVNLAFEARGIEKAGQKVFEDAGETVDPNGEFFIGIKISTVAATAQAGDISFYVVYSVA